MLRNVKYGLRNIFYWLPVIWRWRAWDYAYFLDVIIWALKDMEQLQRKSGLAANAEELADQMLVAYTALERLRNFDDTAFFHLVEDEKGILGKRLKLNQNAPFGSFKAVWDHEAQAKRLYKEIFAKQFVRHVERWWD